MSVASLPAPVLLVGCICLTILLVTLLFLVACVPGAVERIILILDAIYTLFYGRNQRHGKRLYRRKHLRTPKKG